MIFLHIFTEEPSAKNVFEVILPKIIPENVMFRIYSHQGKQDLERGLRSALPSISRIPNSRILITRDQDSSDCKELKEDLIAIIGNNCNCPYKIRIVCRELEAWFLGDLSAIKKAYSRFRPENYIGRAEFRNVDNLTQPNDYLLKIIPEFTGRETLPKLETSNTIAPFLKIEDNKSTSFNATINAIRVLTAK